MKLVVSLAVFLALGVLNQACQAAPAKVTASLISDAGRIVPGQPVTVGVQMKLAPKFHVYWINPGDSGLVTKVRWTLPPGVTAGPMQFPVPHRIDLPGGIVNFGYEGEVLLLTTLQIGSEVHQPIEISADVSWLVCDENSCTPGSARGLTITLPVPTSADRSTIENTSRQLIVPAEKSADVKRVNAHDNVVEIEWNAVPKNIELFPPPDKFWSLEDSTISTTGQITTVKYAFRSQHPKDTKPTSLNPVVGYTLPTGQRRGIELPAISSPHNP